MMIYSQSSSGSMKDFSLRSENGYSPPSRPSRSIGREPAPTEIDLHWKSKAHPSTGSGRTAFVVHLRRARGERLSLGLLRRSEGERLAFFIAFDRRTVNRS